jgi:hypothetical protein
MHPNTRRIANKPVSAKLDNPLQIMPPPVCSDAEDDKDTPNIRCHVRTFTRYDPYRVVSRSFKHSTIFSLSENAVVVGTCSACSPILFEEAPLRYALGSPRPHKHSTIFSLSENAVVVGTCSACSPYRLAAASQALDHFFLIGKNGRGERIRTAGPLFMTAHPAKPTFYHRTAET